MVSPRLWQRQKRRPRCGRRFFRFSKTQIPSDRCGSTKALWGSKGGFATPLGIFCILCDGAKYGRGSAAGRMAASILSQFIWPKSIKSPWGPCKIIDFVGNGSAHTQANVGRKMFFVKHKRNRKYIHFPCYFCMDKSNQKPRGASPCDPAAGRIR